MIYVLYNSLTGEIDDVIYSDLDLATLREKVAGALLLANHVPDVSPETHSVVSGQIVLRQNAPSVLSWEIDEYRRDVNAFRQTLAETGTVVNVSGYGPVALEGREQDKVSLQGLLILMQAQISLGDTSTPVAFMDRDNVVHHLTPPQMVELILAGLRWMSLVWQVSFQIKEEPINPDFREDERWPV